MRDSEFYDASYFEAGPTHQKSNYERYVWLPDRVPYETAFFLSMAGIAPGQRVFDVGCARGFYVRAMVELGMDAYGCDWSQFAIETCDSTVRSRLSCSELPPDELGVFDLVTAIHVLEHWDESYLRLYISRLAQRARRLLVVVPLAHGGRYLSPRHELDASHNLRWSLKAWTRFLEAFFGSVEASTTVPDSLRGADLGLLLATSRNHQA